jgi:hypothetical protein
MYLKGSHFSVMNQNFYTGLRSKMFCNNCLGCWNENNEVYFTEGIPGGKCNQMLNVVTFISTYLPDLSKLQSLTT